MRDGQLGQHDGQMFEGFALHWIDIEDDVRLRVRVGVTARRWCCCTDIPVHTPPGT